MDTPRVVHVLVQIRNHITEITAGHHKRQDRGTDAHAHHPDVDTQEHIVEVVREIETGIVIAIVDVIQALHHLRIHHHHRGGWLT